MWLALTCTPVDCILWLTLYTGSGFLKGQIPRAALWNGVEQFECFKSKTAFSQGEQKGEDRAAESCTGCNWLSLGCACDHSLSTNPPKGSRQSPQSTEESIWHGFLGATQENDTVHFNFQLESTSMELFDRLKKGTVDANSPTAVIHTVMRKYIVCNYQNLLCSDPG